MSFKKTITFTANVSDYTDGTVSARVQAENKILGDLVAWILAQGLNIQQVEKVSIGDAMWSGSPLNATTGATQIVNNDSLLTDVYFLGKGMTKKCLGLSIDAHILHAGFTDTATHDMSYSFANANLENYGRLPSSQLRKLKAYASNRERYVGTVELATFSTSADEISVTFNYYKSAKALVIQATDGSRKAVVIAGDPATVMLYGGASLRALHYSLDDEAPVSEATYSLSATNGNYASNAALQFAMSYSPFMLRAGGSYGVWYQPASSTYCPTGVLMHYLGPLDPVVSINTEAANPENGLNTAGVMPAYNAYGFPRIRNNELYVKKMYIPATYPAVTSPIKIGYTPGVLAAGTVYQLGGKYYVSLTNGVIGYFVEVEDQG